MPNQYDKDDDMEVYTPDIGNSEEIGIDQSTTSYSERLNKLKVGEIIDVKLNEKAIKWRISHDLYKDYRSGVRELFQNEARACRQAIKKYNAKPYIEVKINADTRDFSIQGHDSLGISEAVFDKVLRVLGVSGNTDGGNEVGQFGMGFASYTTLSDIVTVETWYRENRKDGSEEKYSFLGDNGIDFKILPEPSLETYGTKLSLTYNKADNITGIIDMLTECVKFCGVKVTLIIQADWNEYHKFGKMGIYELESYKSLEYCLEQQLAEKYSVYDKDGNIDWNKERITFYKKVHIDNEDYEFIGIIAMKDENNYSQRLSGTMNYHLLASVPIEINFSAHGQWTAYALNIKNERKFMPTADRDRLTNDAEKTIQDMYNAEIRKYFMEYKLESIKDYTNSLAKPFYDYYYNFEDLIPKEIYEVTQEVINTLQTYFKGENGHKNKLIDMLRSNAELFVLKALNSDYMARIRTKIDNPKFFRYKPNDERGDDAEDKYQNTLVLLDEAGVRRGEQFIKDNKIRPLTTREKVDGVKMTNSEKPIRVTNAGYHADLEKDGEFPFGCSEGYGRAYISTTIGDVNNNIRDNMLIFDVKKNLPLWTIIKDHLWTSQSDYVILKSIKGLDTESINLYSNWILKLTKKRLNFVMEEPCKAKDIKNDGDIHLITGDVKVIKQLIKDKNIEGYDKHIIVKDQAEYFEVLCLLSHLGRSCDKWGKNMEDMIEDCSGLNSDYTFYCKDSQKNKIYTKLPAYKIKCSDALFDLTLRAISSSPYDCDKILAQIDEILEAKG